MFQRRFASSSIAISPTAFIDPLKGKNPDNIVFNDQANTYTGGGAQDFSGDISVPATNKMFLDGGDHTSFREDAGNRIAVEVADIEVCEIRSSGQFRVQNVSTPQMMMRSSDTTVTSNLGNFKWFFGNSNSAGTVNCVLDNVTANEEATTIKFSPLEDDTTQGYLFCNGDDEVISLFRNTAISATKKLFLDGSATGIGGDTFISESAANNMKFTAGNTVSLDLNATGIGVFGTTPAAQQTGVAVTAAAIHAALVTFGWITA